MVIVINGRCVSISMHNGRGFLRISIPEKCFQKAMVALNVSYSKVTLVLDLCPSESFFQGLQKCLDK